MPAHSSYIGEFGIVYRATLSGWRGKEQELVAVKTLKGIVVDTVIFSTSIDLHPMGM